MLIKVKYLINCVFFLINFISHFITIYMKSQFFTSLIFCGISLLSQSQNSSQGSVQSFTSILPAPPSGLFPQLLTNERFRFQSGLVTQLESGSNFDFTSSEWFALGKITSGQTFYGLRFQQANRGLTFGYTSASPNKPRIEWIHNGSTTADYLEFRVGNGFGGSGGPGGNTLIASMSPLFGNTYFGTLDVLGNPFSDSPDSPKVGILTKGGSGLFVRNVNTPFTGGVQNTTALIETIHASNFGLSLDARCDGGQSSTAISAFADAQQNAFAVRGIVPFNAQFGAAIYGDAPFPGSNIWAGYFDGDVFCTTGNYLASDVKLKQNILNETSALERIALLRPVSYTFKNVEGMNLSKENQHGFISQEMAEVFPELTKDMTKPVFDEEGNVVSQISLKAINYTGLISVLTAGIQELNTELQAVRQELDDYKANDNVRSQLLQNNNSAKGYSMEQNTPNPFSDRSSIRYQLAPGVEQATISIFNLNGGFVRDYQLEGNAGEITILASEIGKGLFIYSLTQNGQEILSKRMIVK